MMKFEEYLDYFESLLNSEHPEAPYDDPEYFQYAKLNWSRTQRWLKKGVVLPDVAEKIKAISTPQQWIVITEPWCGDAAQCVPFFQLLAQLNPLITFNIELRDQPPFLIDNYLTNGSKSIPVLVMRDVQGKDMGVWGPRPQGAKELFYAMKAEDKPFEDIKEALQKWYNEDAGKQIQQEIADIIG